MIVSTIKSYVFNFKNEQHFHLMEVHSNTDNVFDSNRTNDTHIHMMHYLLSSSLILNLRVYLNL